MSLDIKLGQLEQKTRLRTKLELDVRRREFLEICILLDALKIKYFLLGGILLGAIRNNDFIPWDWDIEICVFSYDVYNNKLLIEKINNTHFKIIKQDNNLLSFKLDLLGKLAKEVSCYTIMGWNHDKQKEIFWRKNFKVPEHFLLNMTKIKLFDKFHYAPYPPEDYLTHQYGDWKKPLRTSDKSIYLTKKFSGISSIEIFIKRIINLIKKI